MWGYAAEFQQDAGGENYGRCRNLRTEKNNISNSLIPHPKLETIGNWKLNQNNSVLNVLQHKPLNMQNLL